MNFELPYIKKKNRIFRIENLIVLENFLLMGENSIYLINDILNQVNTINFKAIIDNLALFDLEDEK